MPFLRNLLETAMGNLLPVLILVALLVLVYLVGRTQGDEPTTLARGGSAPRDTVKPIQKAPELVPVAVAEPPHKQHSLLIADDSAVVRAKLTRLFKGAGYNVTAVNDGLEALQAIPTDFFSVLITDLEMPNLGGIELIASVHGALETEDLPIIAITGHDALQAQIRDCEGLYGIFRKPWNDRELLKRVETLCQVRQRPTGPIELVDSVHQLA